ncbi:MAG: hypothetical protein IT317_08765 [Anaerolineales bacterium]|nr:hypothetical protein [Anaerolineales bacterium]
MNAAADDMASASAGSDGAVDWPGQLAPAGCAVCGVVHLTPPGWVEAGRRCPACARGTLAAQPAPVRPEPPELALPFAVTSAQAAAALEAWAAGVWLRPAELSGPVLQARLAPTYLPMWLVDAEAAGAWTAQAGYAYEVASTNENYQGGQWVTQRVNETRLRWEPRAGQVRRAYANVAAPALEDQAALLKRLGAFPLDKAAAFAPEAAQAAAVRVPTLTPEAAWPFARARLDERVAADVQAAAGAQKLEQPNLTLAYLGRHWTQLLLPVYATHYQDESGVWHAVLINGANGRIAGVRRASQRLGWQWTGVIAAAALALFVLGALLTLAGAVLPPLMALGGLLLVAGFGMGLAALVPAVWAWQFNARSD